MFDTAPQQNQPPAPALYSQASEFLAPVQPSALPEVEASPYERFASEPSIQKFGINRLIARLASTVAYSVLAGFAARTLAAFIWPQGLWFYWFVYVSSVIGLAAWCRINPSRAALILLYLALITLGQFVAFWDSVLMIFSDQSLHALGKVLAVMVGSVIAYLVYQIVQEVIIDD